MPPPCPTDHHRRRWLLGGLGALMLPAVDARAGEVPPGVAEIDAKARAAGLPAFGRTETAHFFGLGDATAEFRSEALNACESMATELLADLRGRGFADLALPREKMIVVVLAGRKSYGAFTGDKDEAVGGQFEPDANRLVMFDFRGDEARPNQGAARINSFTLVHETMHELTFNIGMLDLKGDVPLCISEGLATYGETWRPNRKGPIGQVNHLRLPGLRSGTWSPLARLLVEDQLLRDPQTQEAAYAQSWVLIHAHLKSKERLPRLKAYLAAIRKRRDPKIRLDDARAHLGDLAKLDATLKGYAKRPIGA